MNAALARTRRLSDPVAFLLTAAGYFLAAIVAIPAALPPDFSAPFFPAAGIGLAAVLVRGIRMVPAIALGSMAAALLQMLPTHRPQGVALVVATLAFGLASALQAYLGAALVRRQVGEPEVLTEPRDIANFVGAVALGCLVSATVGNFALLAIGAIHTTALPLALATWWIGDVLGVLVAVPVILALRGRPREAWKSRRLSVGLTLTVLSVLVTLGVQPLLRREQARAGAAFDREVDRAVQLLAMRWTEPLHALEALHGIYLASDEVTADALRRATEAWLASGAVSGMAWSVPVLRADLPAFEASVRASGVAGFRVRRDGAAGTGAGTGTGMGTGGSSGSGGGSGSGSGSGSGEMIVVRDVQPAGRRAALLGVDALSTPGLSEAVERARRSGLPAASVPVISPPPASSAGWPTPPAAAGPAEVIAYRALYQARDPAHLAPAARSAALLGLVSVIVRPADALATLEPALARTLDICLVDATPGATPTRLGGAAGCEARAASTFERTRVWRFADRDWQVRIAPVALRTGSPLDPKAEAWLFALVSLISTALLGGFLLTVTGRARRIEVAVNERTAALQAEVRDRQLAETALRESEQRFRNILDHIPIGVVYTDLDGTVREVNLHFCRLIGRAEAELLGTDLAELTHADDRARSALLQTQLLRDEIALFRRRERYLGRDGSPVWVQATVCLLRSASGQGRSIVSVVEDVSEHRLLEEAERGREAAEASNRAKSDFLSRMSHELRTPLNAMLGFAQLLELDPKQPLSISQKPWVGQIQQAGWHLLEMINDVLDLSRIESGNLRLRLESIDLAELIATTRAMVEGDARARGIRIGQRFDLGDATPVGDPTRVKQILTNLLTNAVKYNADAGRIEIVARRASSDRIQLSVTDTGLGMTPEQLADLFQPFNRLGRERSAQEGTGIGLVISQRLAELMGGSLEARSRAGEGSVFILTLPCSSEPDTIRSDLGPAEFGLAEYPLRQVCYVEDNETNVEVMRGILAQRPQVELSVALTGRDGLRTIRDRCPDLVLLDMHLPDIDGLALLRQLRREPATRAVPVVIVSADALAEQIAAAFDAGCDRYLTKPVSVGEVLAVIDDLLVGSDAPFL